MQEISGTAIAVAILDRLKKRDVQPQKTFTAVLVGEDPVSESFVKRKEVVAAELGIDFRVERFPGDIPEEHLVRAIDERAARSEVGGLMIQLPLPSKLDVQRVLDRVPAEKDADVLGRAASGAFYTGTSAVLPPAVGALKEILESEGASVEKSVIAVVGLGRLVGRPIAVWLAERSRTVHLIDKGGEYEGIKSADIVVLGAGAGNIVDGSMVRDTALVVDFGYAAKKEDGKMCLCGDFSPVHGGTKNVRYTPTPGGTGPVLVAKLFENFYQLNAS